MRPDEIKVGCFYVGRKATYLVREIKRENDAGDVYWRAYDIKTGEPTGDHLMCSRRTMAQWAEREVTAEEKARLNRAQADAKERAEAIRDFVFILRNAPDEMLLDEVQRRGLKLGDE